MQNVSTRSTLAMVCAPLMISSSSMHPSSSMHIRVPVIQRPVTVSQCTSPLAEFTRLPLNALAFQTQATGLMRPRCDAP